MPATNLQMVQHKEGGKKKERKERVTVVHLGIHWTVVTFLKVFTFSKLKRCCIKIFLNFRSLRVFSWGKVFSCTGEHFIIIKYLYFRHSRSRVCILLKYLTAETVVAW